MKAPVPNISGLIYFIQDASIQFTLEEQESISSSIAGQQIKQAYNQCSGHAKQLHDARKQLKRHLQQQQLQSTKTTSNISDTINDEINTMKQQIQINERKYMNCLSYMLCPKLWKEYNKCYDDTIRNVSSPDIIQEAIDDGTIHLICRSERMAIEHCVGTIVSNAIYAGDTSNIESSTVSSSMSLPPPPYDDTLL
jgi:exonuclease VII large subunit